MTNRLLQLNEMYNPNDHDSFILFAIAKEYEKIENITKAIEIYEDLRSKDSEYVGLYYHLAKLYESVHDHLNASLIYDQGIDVAKKIPDYHALSELINAKQNMEMGL